MRIAVTGANGYVGSHVVAQVQREGDIVVKLVRNPAPGSGALRFVLGESLQASSLTGVQRLVHCAYDFRQRTPEASSLVNVEGTRSLLGSARAAGVEGIVVISSMAAFPASRSVYGRSKLAIEDVAREFDATIVRPGLVYGDNAGHLVGALEKQMRKRRVLPLMGGSRPMYLCHVDDLARGVSRLCRTGPPPGVVTVAWPTPVSFREFLRKLARRRMFFLPVPYQPVLWSLRLTESLGLRLGFHSDSLIGLIHNDPHPDFSHLDAIGFDPRPFVNAD